jgi:hypothetical protein
MKRAHHQRNADRKQRRTGKNRMLQIRDEGDGKVGRKGGEFLICYVLNIILRIRFHGSGGSERDTMHSVRSLVL